MIVIFAGPTISHAEIAKHINAICMPPISHGDIIKLMHDSPKAIGIIDGYFEGVPSVWHKEILYALDQGVHVFGASSMGALRAAELDAFGMQGVGQIYEWYRDGVLEDDDEVAVLHGPVEVEFAVASEPMVNIRASLAAAQSQAIITNALHDHLISIAKNVFYKKRSWRGLLEMDRDLDADVSRLEYWLTDNAIDLKKRDAVAMLETMAAREEQFSVPFEADFHFEWTHVWDTAFHSLKQPHTVSASISELDQRILDEVRLDVRQYKGIRDRALLSWLADNAANVTVELADTRKALAEFRQENGLSTRSQLRAYMEANELDEGALTRVMESQARVSQVAIVVKETTGALARLMIDQTKLDGSFAALRETVERKADAGVYDDSAAGRWGVLRPQLLHWYFGEVCGTDVPISLDRHLESIELDTEAFYVLIGAEYLFARAGEGY